MLSGNDSQPTRLIRLCVILAITAAIRVSAAQEEILPGPPLRNRSASWNLESLEEWAERNSPVLPQAAAEVQVQRGRAYQAGLYPNPELQGGSPTWGGSDSQYFAGLSQQIITKHKLQLDRAAICQEVLQAELHFVRARFDLLTNVRQAFVTALTAQQRQRAQARLLDVVKRSTAAAQNLEDTGQGARADTLLLELEQERAEFGLQNAATSYQAAIRQLAAIVGDPQMPITQLEGNLAQPLPDYPFEFTQEDVLARNALVRTAQVEIERNQILLRRAIAQPYPNVTVGAAYMYQASAPNNMAMLQVSVPIPAWNRNQGGINAAQAGVGRAMQAARKTELDLSKQLAGATGRYDVAAQQVAKYENSILPKANESVRLIQRAFQQGQFDLLRVLQSQRALIESELNYLSAQEARWNAAAEISGLLQEEEFPRQHSDE